MLPPPRARERLAQAAWVVLTACGIAACTLDTEGQFAAGADAGFHDAGSGGGGGATVDEAGTGGGSQVGGAAGWPSGGSGGADAGSAGAGAVAGTGGAAGVSGTGGAAGVSGTGGAAGVAGTGGSCDPSEKQCGQECVMLDDPATGCAASDCAPCVFPHGNAICDAGACALGACTSLWGNCNQNMGDGCELDLSSDLANCGACGQVCESSLATVACIAGKCTLQCVDGFADCDGDLSNGCETDTKYDLNNCGTCGHVCTGGFNCMVSHCGCAANSANCGASQPGTDSVECVQLSGADKCRCNGLLCEYGQRCSDSGQCID